MALAPGASSEEIIAYKIQLNSADAEKSAANFASKFVNIEDQVRKLAEVGRILNESYGKSFGLIAKMMREAGFEAGNVNLALKAGMELERKAESARNAAQKSRERQAAADLNRIEKLIQKEAELAELRRLASLGVSDANTWKPGGRGGGGNWGGGTSTVQMPDFTPKDIEANLSKTLNSNTFTNWAKDRETRIEQMKAFIADAAAKMNVSLGSIGSALKQVQSSATGKPLLDPAEISAATTALKQEAEAVRKAHNDMIGLAQAEAKLEQAARNRVAAQRAAQEIRGQEMADAINMANARARAAQEARGQEMADAIGAAKTASEKKKAAAAQAQYNAEVKKGQGIVDMMGVKQDQAAKKAAELANQTNKATSAFGRFNVMTTFLGIMLSQVIHGLLNLIRTTFTTAIQSVKDLEVAFYNLINAEKAMSMSGTEITLTELEEVITRISTKFKGMFSKTELTDATADIAIAVKDLGFGATEVEKMLNAIAAVKLRTPSETMKDVTAHTVTALLSGRTQALQAMGIAANEQTVKEKALEMRLIKSGEALSTNIKALAILQIMYDSTKKETEDLSSYTNTLSGASQRARAAWSNFTLSLMEVISPQLVNGLNSLSDWLISTNDYIEENIDAWKLWADETINTFEMVINGVKQIQEAKDALSVESDIKGFEKNILKGLSELVLSILTAIATSYSMVVAGMLTFFLELPSQGIAQAARDAGNNVGTAFVVGMSSALALYLKGDNSRLGNSLKKWWKEEFGVDLDSLTAPAIIPPKVKGGDGEPTAPKVPGNTNDEDLATALEKMNKEILDAQLKLQQDMEDAAIDMGRKLVDIDIEYARKRADAQTDYINKIADINISYNEKIKDIQIKQREDDAKAKQDQLDKERQFQNDMLELKENYLMSLDDALHNRDARQILKLQAQYELDKLQAERKHGLDKQNAAEEAKARSNSYKEERRLAEADRRAKIAEAQRELADKLAQLEVDRKREIADANLDYERKKQDLEKAMHDRLNIVAANLVSEFNLTKQGLDAIAKLYGKYYSYVAGLYAAMQKMKAGLSASTGTGAIPAAWGSSPATQSGGTGRGIAAAEGGTFIANRPTTITFGEAGLEKATFTPLGRMGRDVSKTFTNVSGLGSGSGGKVSIELVLSPDLESRIIGNSMDATAEVIMRTMRGQR